MNILMISPQAPPKNSPESIQVGRYLEELDKHNHITLVTTAVERGWIAKDDSLDVELLNTDIITLQMPFHNAVIRVLSSQYLKPFVLPDKDFWIRFKASSIIRKLTFQPEIIYSRSLPFSAALLAKDLKHQLGVPWIMHLSDPWVDSPYRTAFRNEKLMMQLELSCFNEADAITVTTESVASFYRNKYPKAANKIFVSSNIMPLRPINTSRDVNKDNDKLMLVYTGALYGKRRATTILKAFEFIKKSEPEMLRLLDIKFVGNMSEDIREEIEAYNFPQVQILGRHNYKDVLEIQAKADIMVSIEPDGKEPLLKTFLPSKMLDYVALGKPILSITPQNSESWKFCNKGYGWSVKPGDSESLAGLLVSLIHKHKHKLPLYTLSPLSALNEYTAKSCIDKLMDVMRKQCKFKKEF